jgi:glycogen operon protein
LIAFRLRNPVLRRKRFFRGLPVDESGEKDLTWYDSAGKELTSDGWREPSLRCLGFRISARAADFLPEHGGQNEAVFVMVNGSPRGVSFAVPNPEERWERVAGTADREWDRRFVPRGKFYRLRAFSVAVFRSISAAATPAVKLP